MRRGFSDEDSSLELLLDTICNVFGGIILIFILLTIVSGSSHPPPPSSASPSASPKEQASIIEDLANRILEAQRMLDALRESRAESPTADVYALIRQAERTLVEKKAEIKEAHASLDAAQVLLSTLEAEIAKRQKEYEELATKTREVRVPGARPTTKDGVFVCIKGGRFYPIREVTTKRGVGGRTYDRSVVKVERHVAAEIVSILPTAAGEPIGPGCENAGKVQALLQNLGVNEEYVYFVVYPDSYVQFNYLKSVVVQKGFSYNWLPLDKGDPIPPIVAAEPGRGVVEL